MRFFIYFGGYFTALLDSVSGEMTGNKTERDGNIAVHGRPPKMCRCAPGVFVFCGHGVCLVNIL